MKLARLEWLRTSSSVEPSVTEKQGVSWLFRVTIILYKSFYIVILREYPPKSCKGLGTERKLLLTLKTPFACSMYLKEWSVNKDFPPPRTVTSFHDHVNPECWACSRMASFLGRTDISSVDFCRHSVHRIPGVICVYIDTVRYRTFSQFAVLAGVVKVFSTLLVIHGVADPTNDGVLES